MTRSESYLNDIYNTIKKYNLLPYLLNFEICKKIK
jgi:hypothetical protein